MDMKNIQEIIKRATERYQLPDGELQVYIQTTEPKVYSILGDEILEADNNYLYIVDNIKKEYIMINHNIIKKIIITDRK